MTVNNPRYRVWHQTHDENGLNEPESGSWLSFTQADQLRAAYFRCADVTRTWIEKVGVPPEHVDETPFDHGARL